MTRYIIEGRKILEGRVKISGNKNAILPCLAASLLTGEEVVLKNVPMISDVRVLTEILMQFGAKVETRDQEVKVKCSKIKNSVLTQQLASKLRASILLVGPLLARTGKIEFFHPGGDVIGKRDINLHLEGFRQLGCKVSVNDHNYKVLKGTNVMSDARIFLEIATVTGTENLILASVIRKGRTVIRNAACEPHVIDLCLMLISMGASIEGIGTSTLTIDGVEKLRGTEFTIGSDNIEFGTYAIAAAITGGEIEIENCHNLDLEPVIWPLSKMGVSITRGERVIKVSAKKIAAISKLITNVWPGFPTDLMSVMIVLATQARGISLLHDWVYESRMFFVDKLISMGANITIADPHRVLISGPTRLFGRNLETPDIRAGMALVLAALVAEGKSIINRAELIERGYEDVVGKLVGLGANIQRMEIANGNGSQ
ncbi:MAG: UDP-N-acetylglucosamine 1-carboxyvinyltransferase [Candidatus Daviesbacteria bacterium GW2011_GWA1_41_61]|nr:MAG: UDP-N-acetylglucosamine 1-carboxyvinyltransferase [Candidatus Daviesbacteria bacterium GW2011_GWB1_41_15]KKS15662.1 MAG: UDP-N-acetylglucosamine 1-carboxyvinyltransferase [Candidatus Daviesbacteria bacterium GW2011_GWA1_41_61]